MWHLWKLINLEESFEKTLGRHSGESFSIFSSNVASVEINQFGRVFKKKALGQHSGESLPIFSSLVTFVEINKILSSILKRHLVAIQVKAFQFSVLLSPLWK